MCWSFVIRLQVVSCSLKSVHFGYSDVWCKPGHACCAFVLELFTDRLSKQKYFLLHIMNWFWASILILVCGNHVSVLDVSAHGVEQNVSFVAPKVLTYRDGLVSRSQRLWAFRKCFFNTYVILYVCSPFIRNCRILHLHSYAKVPWLSESQKYIICIKQLNNLKVTRCGSKLNMMLWNWSQQQFWLFKFIYTVNGTKAIQFLGVFSEQFHHYCLWFNT